MSEQVAALQITRRAVTGGNQPDGNLELFQGIFEQIHFLVSQAEIEMRFVVAVRCELTFALSRDTIRFKDLSQTRIDCRPRRGCGC